MLFAVPIPLASRLSPRSAAPLFIAALLTTTTLSGLLIASVLRSGVIRYSLGGWPAPIGIEYRVGIHAVSSMFMVSLVSLLVGLYSVWYGRHELGSRTPYFYTLALTLLSGVLGVIATWDIFNLYVMLELAAASSYGLVALRSDRARALAAGARYAVYGVAAATLMLFAIALLYYEAGVLHLDGLRERFTSPHTVYGCVSMAVLLWASMFFLAVFPNHFWLPDAHSEAPSPASAMLSGVSMVSALFMTSKLLYALPKCRIAVPVLAVSSASSLYASFMLARSRDVKRALGYSTTVNTSLMLMGLVTGGALGVGAAVAHALTHAVGKALAFLALGVFVHKFRTRNIYALEGAGRVYPLAFLALSMAFLSLVGLPPFSGFFSKLYLYYALALSGYIAPAAILVLVSAISLYGYLRIVEHLWHVPPYAKPYTETLSSWVKVALLGLVALLLILSVFIDPLVQGSGTSP